MPPSDMREGFWRDYALQKELALQGKFERGDKGVR